MGKCKSCGMKNVTIHNGKCFICRDLEIPVILDDRSLIKKILDPVGLFRQGEL